MATFTIEATYLVACYKRRTVKARSVSEACRQVIDQDDDWDGSIIDYESAGETHITDAWAGSDPDDFRSRMRFPTKFGLGLLRKGRHFEELLDQLDFAAQHMALAIVDFEHWLPRARAAIEKGRAIVDGRADPGDALG